MSVCPHCQAELSAESLQAGVCLACLTELSASGLDLETGTGGTLQISDIGAVAERPPVEPSNGEDGTFIIDTHATSTPDEPAIDSDSPEERTRILPDPAAGTADSEGETGTPDELKEAQDNVEGPRPTLTEATLLLDTNGLVDNAALTVFWDHAQVDDKGRFQSPDAQRPGLSRLKLPKRSLVERGKAEAEAADYRIDTFVAEGGMGKVFLASQNSLGRHVAIKTLKKDARYTSDQIAQRQDKFLLEAVITGDLDHPNIVPIHEIGVAEDGEVFYSMKYIRGKSWDHARTRKTLEENIDVLLRVCDAVAYAHSKNIVHRDIKPENVMLGDFGEVLVTDWGIAISLDSQESFSLACDPRYASPELTCGPRSAIGKHSDIYLLGAALFQIIVGKPPRVPAENMHDAFQRAARNEIIPVPPEKESELLAIAMRAMATKPTDRYRTVESFQKALRDYQRHEESLRIADRATLQLVDARKSKVPADFARAVVSYEDALSLWDLNTKANRGLRDAKIAYAENALETENYELGLSIINANDQTTRPLYDKLTAGKKERDTRRKRLRLMRYAAAALLASLIIGGTVFSISLKRGKDRETALKNQEIDARKAAQENELQAQEAKRHAFRYAIDSKWNEGLSIVNEWFAKANAIKANWYSEIASRQRAYANEKANEARRNADEAVRNLRTAERQSFLTQISLLNSRLAEDDVDFGGNALKQLSSRKEIASLRDWECQRFLYECQNTGQALPGEFDLLATAGQDGFVTVANDSDGARVQAWSSPAGEEKANSGASWTVAGLSARCVAVSADGRWAVVAGEANDDGSTALEIRALGDGQPQLRASFAARDLRAPNQHILDKKGLAINGACFDAAGTSLFIAGGEDFGFRRFVREETRWRPAEILYFARPKPAKGGAVSESLQISAGHQITCSADGQLVAAIGNSSRDDGSGSVIVWDLKVRPKFDEPNDARADRISQVAQSEGGLFNDVAFDAQGALAAAGHDGRIVVWSNARQVNEPGAVLLGHRRPVRRVHFDADGRKLVSCGDDLAVLVWKWPADLSADADVQAAWEEASGQEPLRLRGHHAAVSNAIFSSEDRVLAVSSSGELRSWNLTARQGDLVVSSPETAGSIVTTLDPSGTWIVVGGEDGVLRRAPGPLASNRSAAAQECYAGHQRFASPVRMNAEACQVQGRRYLVTLLGDARCSLCLWDAESGLWLDRVDGVPGSRIFQVAADAGLILAGQDYATMQGYQITDDRLAPVKRDELTAIFQGLQTGSFAVSADGKRAVGLAAGRLRAYEASDGLNWRQTPVAGDTDGSLIGFLGGGDYVAVEADETTLSLRLFTDLNQGESLQVPNSIQAIRLARGPIAAAAIASLREPGSSAEDCTLSLFSGEDGRQLASLATPNLGDFDVDADGLTMAWSVSSERQQAQQEALLDAVMIETGGARKELSPGDLAIVPVPRTVRFVGDEQLLLAGAGPTASVARIVDASQGDVLVERARLASRSPIIALQHMPEGDVLTATRDGVIYHWSFADPDRPRITRQLSHPALQQFDQAAFLDAGRRMLALVQGDLYELLVSDQGGQLAVHEPIARNVVALDAGRGGAFVIARGDRGYHVMELGGNGSQLELAAADRLAGPLSPRAVVAVSDDGLRVAALVGDIVQVWWRADRTAAWEAIGRDENAPDDPLANLRRRAVDVVSLAFSPSDSNHPAGRRLLIGDAHGGVSVWQLADPHPGSKTTCQEMYDWNAHRHAVSNIEFVDVAEAAGGIAKYLVTSTDHGECRVWPAASRQLPAAADDDRAVAEVSPR